jgi:hypothetical protein
MSVLECSRLPMMRSRPTKLSVRVVIFVVVVVVLLALPIWLGIGPVLLSL